MEKAIDFDIDNEETSWLSDLSSLSSTIASDVETVLFNESGAEERLSKYSPRRASDDTVKVLRSFIVHLPIHGKNLLSAYIKDCSKDLELKSLAEHLTNAILIPLKAKGGRTPSITPSPLLELSDVPPEEEEEGNHQLDDDDFSATGRSRELRNACLSRDGNRCLVSGVLNESVTRQAEGSRGENYGSLEAVHIIPHSLGQARNRSQKEKAQICWTSISLLFPALQKISPKAIDGLTNVLTLTTHLYLDFGRFRLALMPTETPDTYRIETYNIPPAIYGFFPPADAYGRRFVTFRHHNNSPRPDPALLELQAVLAQILHASGQAEKIDELNRKWEETGCLAEDGSDNLGQLLESTA